MDALLQMPPPHDVSTLRSFLGSVQFYHKFLPSLSTVTEPLTRLTRKNSVWVWRSQQESVFKKVKELLLSDVTLAHFDKNLPVGIAADASEVGIGAVLFHRYTDGTERPIFHISKTLSSTQRRYSQIHKEALSIIYAIQKFHQYLYGRRFILVTDHKPLLSLFNPTKGTPILAANHLARWALILQQYDYSIEFRNTGSHGNADVLSRLPSGSDISFDEEEDEADLSTVCTVRAINQQLKPANAKTLSEESKKDPTISTVMRFVQQGWPRSIPKGDFIQFKKLDNSLIVEAGVLLFGNRIVIPSKLGPQVLQLLHLGHFGMQRMKQLARSSVYWPDMNSNIEDMCRSCTSCTEHQNDPPKQSDHPWMVPEKPWSRFHIDHAINFLGTNWLIVVDAFSKYPCIHSTASITSKATMDLLEKDFAHFGYPHTLVSDNAQAFLSEDFQTFLSERGIIHLTGAPYHPATNGQAERFIQTFKNSMNKSKLPPNQALQEFLIQYRRTPLESGLSPSELLKVGKFEEE